MILRQSWDRFLALCRSRRYQLRIVAAVLAAVLPLAVVLMWRTADSQRNARIDARSLAEYTLKRVDTILLQARGAIFLLAPLDGQPCSALSRTVREQGRMLPYLRSLMLVKQGRVYCSSLRGAVNVPVQDIAAAADQAGRSVVLVDGSPLAPSVPALMYYQSGRDRQTGVLVAVEGRYLLDLLLLPESHYIASIAIRVADRSLRSDSATIAALPPANDKLSVTLTSAAFPVAITVAASDGLVAYYRNVFIWSYVPIALFVGLIAGYAVWWGSGRRFSAEGDLAQALRNNEFRVHYQPVIDAATGRARGAEALLRWAHPVRGMVGPDTFVPLAEECGLIVPLTRHLFRLVRRDFGTLAYPAGFHLGINLAPEHFRDGTLVDDIRALLSGLARRPLKLVAEITERHLLDDSDATLIVMKQLRMLGVTLALDDFGTGHSSLAYLQKYQMDYLKIDKGFVATIDTDAINGAVLDTIIQLGHRLQLVMVAEGVETRRQAEYLAQQGVQFLQGYWFARPMPAEELQRWLRRDGAKAPTAIGS
jgi:sensor c-di-GMP phosphodiesterase-like protein